MYVLSIDIPYILPLSIGMVVPCWSLLLLVPVLSLSGATDYYVRPTEPPETPCPSQPCLTLNAYYTEYDYYFKSNTVFRFMQGTHHVDRPLVFSNLVNVSLEAATPHATSNMQPEIVATFKCNVLVDLWTLMHLFTLNFALDTSECSSIQVSDSYDVRLKGIEIRSNITEWKMQFPFSTFEKPQSLFMTTMVSSEISFNDVKKILLYNITAMRGVFVNNSIDFSAVNCMFGYINNFEPLCDSTLYPTNDSLYGVFIHNSSNIVMSNITVINTLMGGIVLQDTNHAQIDNTVLLFIVYGKALHILSSWNTNVNNMDLQKICNSTISLGNVVLERAVYTVVKGIKVNDRIYIANCIEMIFVNLSMANLKLRGGFLVRTCTNVTLQNSTFTNFMDPGTLSTDVVNLPAVVYIYFSLGVRFCDCTFARNNLTNIKSIASNFSLSGDVKFLENRALSGTAIIISHKSNMTLEKDCNAAFINNQATRTGGAIHVMTGEDAVVERRRPWCFLHVSGRRDHPRLVFRGNTARKGGDVLYGGRLELGDSGETKNCMQSFKNISNISQDSLSLIASDPSRVCFCNSSGKPDCLKLIYPERQTIYPGQTIIISVVATGQDFGTVAGSVFAQFLRLTHGGVPKLETLQYSQAVGKDYCNQLNYTIYHSQDGPSNAVLVFTPEYKDVSYFIRKDSVFVRDSIKTYLLWVKHVDNYTPFPKQVLEYPVYVNITLLPCPLGFQLYGILPKCECSSLLTTLPGVSCDIRDQTISRAGLVWVGVMKGSNGSLATSEYCPLNYCHSKEVRIGMGEFNSQCNYDRSGMLCGECKPGLSVALGSSQCLSCSNWYLNLAVPFAMAGVALVFFIKVLDLTTSQGTITGLIFYANIVRANEFIFLPRKETNPLTIFIAWLNLDLGIETCFWDGLTSYSKTWLQFAFPLYIWAIAGTIVILSKYCDRVAKIMGKNSVSVLATLFFLSYAKLLRIIIIALSYTIIDTSHGHTAVWSADGNMDYLGPYHALLFSVSVTTLLFLWLPYTLLLFCGQWLHRCNCRPVVRMLVKTKPLLDAYYGPIKGTHRYWFGAQLLVKAVILLISAIVPSNNSGTIVLSISVSSVVLGFSSIGLYHSKFISIFELSFFLNLALLGISTLFAMSTERNPTTATYVHIGVAFAQFFGLVMYRLSVIFDAKRRILTCCDCWTHKEGEDDWELNEHAACERENGACMTDRVINSEGSFDSLPIIY